MGQVGQHLHRQALAAVHAVGKVGQLAHLPARFPLGNAAGRHPAKARRGKAQHAADDAKHIVGGVHSVVRARHQDAAALSSRHHNVAQSSRRNNAQPDEAAQCPQPEKHRKDDAHSQQSHARAVTLLGAFPQLFHRGQLRARCKEISGPLGHPGVLLCRAAVGMGLPLALVVAVPGLPHGLARLRDAVIGRMNSGLAHIKGPVADVHAPAFKAVGKGIGHGVAKGAQLLFQLLLHLFSLVFLC